MQERIFGESSMGFRRTNRDDLDASGMTRFLENSQPVEDSDPSALRILKDFGRSLR